jgi:hypothetical protein
MAFLKLVADELFEARDSFDRNLVSGESRFWSFSVPSGFAQSFLGHNMKSGGCFKGLDVYSPGAG